MVSIVFITRDNERIIAEANAGEVLLQVAQNAGMPLEGTCEGQMACSTCHVILDQAWFARLPEAREEEEDMLDLAAGVTGTSRLSCQIELTTEMDGMEVRIPGISHDMQVR
ncbi:ferredoxin [Novosphingobium marinum]|uniref:Ferredoxin n=1 Tax=Novosphingobium marinum TaxID=1514948 RepID=A0A7Z0BS16_9SPHN|nr:2Fe-2S iron-sulfur cluster-binding protein [Novosphingobium marinum]NYH94416.1 ferredoxin [Novosphingobium marinum]GGC22189.1 ferredoxin [Novosphingobium marinum]